MDSSSSSSLFPFASPLSSSSAAVAATTTSPGTIHNGGVRKPVPQPAHSSSNPSLSSSPSASASASVPLPSSNPIPFASLSSFSSSSVAATSGSSSSSSTSSSPSTSYNAYNYSSGSGNSNNNNFPYSASGGLSASPATQFSVHFRDKLGIDSANAGSDSGIMQKRRRLSDAYERPAQSILGFSSPGPSSPPQSLLHNQSPSHGMYSVPNSNNAGSIPVVHRHQPLSHTLSLQQPLHGGQGQGQGQGQGSVVQRHHHVLMRTRDRSVSEPGPPIPVPPNPALMQYQSHGYHHYHHHHHHHHQHSASVATTSNVHGMGHQQYPPFYSHTQYGYALNNGNASANAVGNGSGGGGFGGQSLVRGSPGSAFRMIPAHARQWVSVSPSPPPGSSGPGLLSSPSATSSPPSSVIQPLSFTASSSSSLSSSSSSSVSAVSGASTNMGTMTPSSTPSSSSSASSLGPVSSVGGGSGSTASMASNSSVGVEMEPRGLTDEMTRRMLHQEGLSVRIRVPVSLSPPSSTASNATVSTTAAMGSGPGEKGTPFLAFGPTGSSNLGGIAAGLGTKNPFDTNRSASAPVHFAQTVPAMHNVSSPFQIQQPIGNGANPYPHFSPPQQFVSHHLQSQQQSGVAAVTRMDIDQDDSDVRGIAEDEDEDGVMMGYSRSRSPESDDSDGGGGHSHAHTLSRSRRESNGNASSQGGIAIRAHRVPSPDGFSGTNNGLSFSQAIPASRGGGGGNGHLGLSRSLPPSSLSNANSSPMTSGLEKMQDDDDSPTNNNNGNSGNSNNNNNGNDDGGMTHRELAIMFGLCSEKDEVHFRLRDFRRSLLSKLSPAHKTYIDAHDMDRRLLLDSVGRRKMTPREFAEKLIVVQFHYQLHNGRLPSFSHKVDKNMFSQHVDASMSLFSPEVGRRAYAYIKKGMTMDEAVRQSVDETRNMAFSVSA
eukprot:ANDGO_01925.mRNA.1 hypothetical protein